MQTRPKRCYSLKGSPPVHVTLRNMQTPKRRSMSFYPDGTARHQPCCSANPAPSLPRRPSKQRTLTRRCHTILPNAFSHECVHYTSRASRTTLATNSRLAAAAARNFGHNCVNSKIPPTIACRHFLLLLPYFASSRLQLPAQAL